jgi:hypothetical protein
LSDLFIRLGFEDLFLRDDVNHYLRPQLLDDWVREELPNQLRVVVLEDASEDTNAIFSESVAHGLACVVDTFGWVDQQGKSPDLII